MAEPEVPEDSQTLTIRSRRLGYVGPNAWLTIGLSLLAGGLIDSGLRRYGCTESSPSRLEINGHVLDGTLCTRFGTRWSGWDDVAWSLVVLGLVAGATAVAVGTLFHPVVEFGPRGVRWRNRLGWTAVASSNVTRLHWDSVGRPRAARALFIEIAGRRPARLFATMSSNPLRRAETTAAIQEYAATHGRDLDIGGQDSPDQVDAFGRRVRE